MLLLRVIDQRGETAQHVAANFPCSIGRAANSDFQVEAPGVWERHATIHLTDGGKFVLRAEGGALILAGGAAIQEMPLLLGQELSLGSARLTAGLAPAGQRSLGLAEAAVWVLLLFVALAEAALIFVAA